MSNEKERQKTKQKNYRRTSLDTFKKFSLTKQKETRPRMD